MKVGDYVRTEKGIIGKFNVVKTGETIPNWNGGYGYKEIDKEYIDNNVYNRFDDKIIKSSPNIIDLIEIGDFVNGKKVIDTFTDYIFDYSEEFKVIRFSETDILHNSKHIKSIVTKEQFESTEYKIGE